MICRICILLFFSFFYSCVASAGGGGDLVLERMNVDVADKASLQRGARLYFDNCQGCHALQYMRYGDLAKGIGITDEAGNIYDDIVKDSLLLIGEKLSDHIASGIQNKDSEAWFGKAAPDLTLATRVRGANWIYSYMKSFYKDDSKPWGVNNTIFPDVGMPHVLVGLQGVQEAKYVDVVTVQDGEKVVESVIESIHLSEAGSYTEAEYDTAVKDIVNFLSYCAEPKQLLRKSLGVAVLMFLAILIIFSYLLKREYWKDIPK